MKYVRKTIEEKKGKIYIHLYAPDHLNCRAHKAIQTFKSSMFDVMGFDDSYTHEMKPTYYVVHGLIEQYDWIDLELGMTNEFRDFVIKNATNAEPLNAEGVKYDRMNGVINKLIDRHERIIKKNPPLTLAIIGLKTIPNGCVVYSLDEESKYHVVDVISLRESKSLNTFNGFFGKYAKALNGKKCVVKVVKNSREVNAFSEIDEEVYNHYSLTFFNSNDNDLRRLPKINDKLDSINVKQSKTFRRLAIALNYKK